MTFSRTPDGSEPGSNSELGNFTYGADQRGRCVASRSSLARPTPNEITEDTSLMMAPTRGMSRTLLNFEPGTLLDVTVFRLTTGIKSDGPSRAVQHAPYSSQAWQLSGA